MNNVYWHALNDPSVWPGLEQYGLSGPKTDSTGVPNTFRCRECTLIRPNSMNSGYPPDTCTECLANMTAGP